MHGGDALRARLDQLGAGPTNTTGRGDPTWLRQFKELARSGRGYEAMREAGVHGSVRTQQRWLSGLATASPANRGAIARAYRASRGARLIDRLSRGEEGTRVEVYPDREIARQSAGGVGRRNLQVFRDHATGETGSVQLGWQSIVDTWLRDDHGGLVDIWEHLASLLYPPRAYIIVDHLGFG